MLHSMQSIRPESFSQNKPYNNAPRVVPIAPAPENQKKYTYKGTYTAGVQTASIARRNARERNRVKQVNDGFNALRKRLPAAVIAALSGNARRGSGKKLSKVDTLRMVVEYIRYMENLIEESDAAMGYTRENTLSVAMETQQDLDEGFAGRVSPYSESVPSPANSDCSSGVSSAYSSRNGSFTIAFQSNEEYSPVDENELLDAISWWQHK